MASNIHTGVGLGIEFGNPRARGVVFSLDIIYTLTFKRVTTWELDKLGLLPSASVHYNY